MAKKNAAAVALGRKGGKKGGPARAAKLSPEQRSASARKAVLARWAKKKTAQKHSKSLAPKPGRAVPPPIDTSDDALARLLRRLKTTVDVKEIRALSDQIERIIFHKQLMNA